MGWCMSVPAVVSEDHARLLYLAEELASVHACPDFAWLAGRFEFLGEKALGASLSVLAIADEAGVYRPVAASPHTPANARALRDALGVARLPSNAVATALLADLEQSPRPAVVRVAELFQSPDQDCAQSEAIVAPVVYNRESIGVAIFLVGPSPVNEQIAVILAQHVAVAIDELRQHDDARRLHSVDPILWVPDEHFLLGQLQRELSRARRYHRQVGLAVVRCETETAVRAQFGDFFADHLLRRIGSHLLAQVRDSDVLGVLHGGYAVIHNETSLAGTRLSAERLRESVTRMLDQRVPEVSGLPVSLAVVAYPESGETLEDLLRNVCSTESQAPAVA